MKQESRRRRNRKGKHRAERRGSTLLIVMVLMGMLSLLGVIFYVFAAQERSNAEYYSEASKELEAAGLDADILFDFALEQIIVGTEPHLKNSMLWGSRHSLLSNMVGFNAHKPSPDMQPFNGEGINVIFDVNTGFLGVDQDRNGTIEPSNAYLLNYNNSPAANALAERRFNGEDTNWNEVLDPGEDRNNNGVLDGVHPQSDVGFTYPDINNIFLCYVGEVRDTNGNIHRVVKPSYMVPGVLRTSAAVATNSFWYNDSTTGARVMRGHPSHLYVPPTSSPATPAPRYLNDAEAASLIGAGAYGFPVSPMASNYDTTGGGAGPVVTAGRMGAYSFVDPSGTDPPNEPVELDWDNDGDGINESILMDLDFPPQEDAFGKLFVPLFLVTIHDLDALLNLNAHGNLSKILYGPSDISNGMATTNVSSGGTGAWFGTDSSDGNFYFVSQSNLGLGPAEINPLWALNRRIGLDGAFTFTQHQTVFGSAPTLVTSGSAPMWGETANMEFFWSKIGRFQVTPSKDLFVGVYGEAKTLFQATNGAGRITATAGGAALPRPGYSLADDNGDLNEGQGVVPFYQHPLDYTGRGSYMSGPKAMRWATPGGGADPANRWIQYSKYGNSNPANVRWGQAAGLMTTPVTQGLGDDPHEVAFYATDNRDSDSVLAAEENLYLHLSNGEIDRLNVTSRLANLLPFNFDKAVLNNPRAEGIRRKFTVLSNDRKSFSLPVSARSNTEYNLNVDSETGKVTKKFPPQFGSISRYSTAALAEDPFRPALRYLLEIEINSPNITRPQRKLNLNGLLTGSSTTPMAFRPLTPHPDDPGTTPITTTYPAPAPTVPYPPTTAAAREYWARRDRQQLARDIYVMLYLLGHGVDTVDVTATGAYTPAQCKEMAQFAVNLVDAMDRDTIITRFEYDTDLNNGWNLDDDAYTSGTTVPSTSELDREEVYGVERLDLSISEGMVIRTEAITPAADHPATSYPDAAQHHFAFAEISNQSPFDVTFNDKEAWQIVLRQPGTFERRLSFNAGALVVPAGQRYTVGSADADLGGMAPGKSIFKVDPNWVSGTPDFTMSPTWMAPYQQALISGTSKGLDLLDVVTPSSAFRVEDGANPPNDLTATVGSWAAALSTADPAQPIEFLLRRRAHPERSRMSPPTSASENDNPWVTVDQMRLPRFGTFTLMTAMDNAATIQMALNALTGSTERTEPFARSTGESEHPPNNMGNNNTLTGSNSTAVNPFTVWQPHFDRDFTSIMDLLYLPLMGPDQMTNYLEEAMGTAAESQTTPRSAAAMFLNPNTATPNRWHRLLELVEIPTRTNRNLGIGTDFSIPRVPGRMNLNMLRHAENWAALLDDNRYFGLDMTVGTVPAGSDNPPYMPDTSGEGSRDWWRQFLMSRDGMDPFAYNINGVTVSLPGLPGYSAGATPGSRPFRSLADVSYTAAGGTKTPSVEDTILRSLPVDTGATKRRLLEIGTNTEHNDGDIDPLIRHRLLSKIAGNTTTRSNSFAIFVSVKYFAAASDPAYGGAIRIGGPYNGKAEPEHRGFFVVDRTKLEQGKYTGASNYDFRAFIDYRKTLATQ